MITQRTLFQASFNFQLSVVLIILLSAPQYLALPSCSSFELPLQIYAKTLAKSPQFCSFTASDSISAHLYLESIDFLQLYQVEIKITTQSKENWFFTIYKTKNEYNLKIRENSKEISENIAQTTGSMLFTANMGMYYFSGRDGSFDISGGLGDATSSYILTIQARKIESDPEVVFLTSHSDATSRFLYQCSEGFYLFDGACSKVCPKYYYGQEGVCHRCPENCDRCLSAYKCNPCKKDQIYLKETGTCLQRCPETYYEDTNNRICVKCYDGCNTCTFPNGQCNIGGFKTDMMINLFVSAVLLCLIVLCAFMCNTDKKDETANTSIKNEQPQQGSVAGKAEHDSPKKPQEKQKATKKTGGNQGAGPYNALAEENMETEQNPPQVEPTNEEREQQRVTELKHARRLANIRKSRLLSLSISKPFAVDDSNDDYAIPHESTQKVTTQPSPLVTISTKRSNNSPLFGPRDGLCSRLTTQGGSDQPESRILNTNTGLTERELVSYKGDRKSPFYFSHRGEVPTQLGLFGKRQKSSDFYQISEPHLAVKDDSDHQEEEKKDGYRSDTSISEESDGYDEWEDRSACEICSLNKKDCINKPCQHKVACYACMEQFKEAYGVCPQCKEFLTQIEKIVSKEKKFQNVNKLKESAKR